MSSKKRIKFYLRTFVRRYLRVPSYNGSQSLVIMIESDLLRADFVAEIGPTFLSFGSAQAVSLINILAMSICVPICVPTKKLANSTRLCGSVSQVTRKMANGLFATWLRICPDAPSALLVKVSDPLVVDRSTRPAPQQAGTACELPVRNKFSSRPMSTSRAFSPRGPSTRWIGAGSARDTVATRIV